VPNVCLDARFVIRSILLYVPHVLQDHMHPIAACASYARQDVQLALVEQYAQLAQRDIHFQDLAVF